ncbi:MAG: ABC transporter ATP-binding protein [Caldilinea sp.]|nr:ABC transporter ATP-binding protein [Caldilinea sp.]MCB0147805.1 ABC transporter ATP-binding protein [Caldilineaceae bacterium]MCB0048011.1 ABC transporter ATP-binding protein [Caldilinea sp.]MCB9116187.1 ABC transporter ATP-binding protein [Caldilineaceae bacterium]MCB9118862.1 ABC transporter ATP-binding protein [Caldilineaceae bacterium]
MTETTPLFVAEGISKRFADGPRPIQALQPVSFRLAEGEFVCLVGPSGSGKSTLLRIMGGLVPADGGAMWFAGAPHNAPDTQIGFVFQKTNLMPWRTVLQNTLLPTEIQQKKVTKGDQQRAVALLDTMGLADFEHAYPRQLSGGMNQRVVLARALMQQPRLLLMDEPFGQLDALTRERLNLELLRLFAEQRFTVFMVTHSITEAVLLADRVFVLSERPGRLIAQIAVPLPRPRRLDMINTATFGEIAMQVRANIGEA